jgi:ABC-type nickel/cobalt efflux system permease component RcnA
MFDQKSKLSAAIEAVMAILAISLVILLVATLVSLPFVALKDLSGWVQATGAVIAIVTGFYGVLYQVEHQRKEHAEARAEIGRAAHTLASEAFDLVTDRLSSALSPGKASSLYALRGLRTTEMVTAMREFDAGALPTKLIAPFATLRTCVFAINSRITEVYSTEEGLDDLELAAAKASRRDELQSAVRVHATAADTFTELDKLAQTLCHAAPHPQKALVLQSMPEPVA